MSDPVWSDAWVLLALLDLARPTPREDIPRTGDSINQPKMSNEELDGGLARLMALVLFLGFLLALTCQGRHLSSTRRSIRLPKRPTIGVRKGGRTG